MDIKASDVAKLREMTGVGMMEAKKALVEVGGDLEKAGEYLRKNGSAKAAKKADRVTGEGRVHCYTHSTGKIGVMVEVLCETDFVARNPAFIEFYRLKFLIFKCYFSIQKIYQRTLVAAVINRSCSLNSECCFIYIGFNNAFNIQNKAAFKFFILLKHVIRPFTCIHQIIQLGLQGNENTFINRGIHTTGYYGNLCQEFLRHSS